MIEAILIWLAGDGRAQAMRRKQRRFLRAARMVRATLAGVPA